MAGSFTHFSEILQRGKFFPILSATALAGEGVFVVQSDMIGQNGFGFFAGALLDPSSDLTFLSQQ